MNILIIAIFLMQSPPKIDGWEEITKTNYELKNTIKLENQNIVANSFIGFFKIYKNPNLKNEFVLVGLKYPAITFIPKTQRDESKSSNEVLVIENYSQKTKQEKLKERTLSSDMILFIKWRETEDPRTKEKILHGPIENWLLNYEGRWVFEMSAKSAVKIELLSEPEIIFAEKNILTGFKFSLGTDYHILRFDQDHLGGKK